jgi:hypothetical protein
MTGVEVWITGEDKVPIKEYAVEIDEEDDVATCWITGEPGQVSFLFSCSQFICSGLSTTTRRKQRRDREPDQDLGTIFASAFSVPINVAHGGLIFFQPFAIRWRDISDPIACPVIDGYYSDPYVVQRDLSGFVMMDGYELGGRVLHARSHSPAIFSRIATSPTSCVPLTFSNLPRSAGMCPIAIFLASFIILSRH